MVMTRREPAACELFPWEHVRKGSIWTGASQAAGVDRTQGYRWRKANGFWVSEPPREVNGRCLSLDERLSIADLRIAGGGVRAIASALVRAPSTISREMRRNSTLGPPRGPRSKLARVLRHRPYAAHERAAARALRPKLAKADDPVTGAVLSGFITAEMDLRWSPQQTSHELAVAHLVHAQGHGLVGAQSGRRGRDRC